MVKRVHPARLWGMLLLGALAACTRAPHLPGDLVDERRVVILQPGQTALHTSAAARALSAALPGAAREPLARFDEVFSNALARAQVVVVPHLESLPCEVWSPLNDFLAAGGCAVLWSPRPFAERVWTSPTGFQTETELARSLLAGARPGPWPEVQAWRLQSDPPQTGLVLRLADDAGLPWPGVRAEIPATPRWAGIQADVAPAPAGAAILALARGDERTPSLLFQLRAGSDTWWRAAAPLSSSWQPLLLPAEAFVPAAASTSGPPPSLDRITAIRAGVWGDEPDQPRGPYAFALSDVRVTEDPRGHWPRPPQWPGLPGSRTYVLPAAVRLETAGGTAVALAGQPQVILPEYSPGCGGGSPGQGRLIPVARAVQGGPDRTGVCAQIYADLRPDRPLRRYAWLGVEAAPLDPAALRPLLRELVSRLQTGHLILDAGLGVASAREGEALLVRFRHVPDLLRSAQAVRINLELLEPGGKVARRVTATPRGPEPQVVDLGRAPDAHAGGSDFILRIRVMETLTATILDEVSWPLRMVAARAQAPPRRPVEATGSLLTEAGRPVFPLITSWEAPDAEGLLLDGARYPAARVGYWLDRAREAGFNTLSLRLEHEEQLPQFEHLAGELEGRRMRVLLQLTAFPPLHTDWAAARRLARALAQARTDPVLAFDVAASAPLPPASDPAWRAAWSDWLVEQYGSHDAAGRLLSCATTAALAEAWAEDPATASAPVRLARQRCRADVISRHVAALRGLWREHGLLHAFTMSGEPDAGEAALAAAHLDVITLTVDTRRPAAEEALRFRGAWARGLAGGRPIWWKERGPVVSSAADATAKADQAAQWAELLQVVERTAAAGGWLAAGGEQPAFLGVHGHWRPAVEPIRRFSHQLRGAPIRQAAAWEGWMLDPWSDPGGWTESFARRRAERPAGGSDPVAELRPAGFGIETRRLEPRPLTGGSAFVPWRELNAEWTGAWVNGEPVGRAPGQRLSVKRRDKLRLAVCNTGPATWTPWTGRPADGPSVRVLVYDGTREREQLRAPRLAMHQVGFVEWTPAEAGRRELRVMMPSTGPWGEALVVEILP